MKSMNRVFLMGHLGGAPELRTSKNGNPYTRLRLATNKFMAKEDGTKDTKTDWHSVFVWGDDANRCAEYLRTGALVFVEGSLSYWEVALEGTKMPSKPIESALSPMEGALRAKTRLRILTIPPHQEIIMLWRIL
jgi:single stranded DNA-binding protein